MMRRGRLLVFAIMTVGLASPIACSNKKKDDGTSPVAEDSSLPKLVIRDDTPSLMLTWIDEKGDTHVELHPPEVPASGRDRVRVIVSDREEGTRDLFYVVDLNKKGDDGGYTAQVMRRREWEAEIEKRRAAYIARVSPPPSPSAPASAGEQPGKTPPPVEGPYSGITVTIYGASWCKPCHQAHDYLHKKGVTVIMKDIESTPGAEAEMRKKLIASGNHGGSIPVIDVRGQILVGFSPRALDRALEKAKGTVL